MAERLLLLLTDYIFSVSYDIFPQRSISSLILSLKTTDLPFRKANTASYYIKLALSPIILAFTTPESSPTTQFATSNIYPLDLFTDSLSTDTTYYKITFEEI